MSVSIRSSLVFASVAASLACGAFISPTKPGYRHRPPPRTHMTEFPIPTPGPRPQPPSRHFETVHSQGAVANTNSAKTVSPTST